MSKTPPGRTPSQWAKSCLGFLREIDSGYERNRQAKGRFIEFVRQHSTGLLVSHNFIKVGDAYHLCFALLFSRNSSEQLVSPLAFGSRFDDNRTIWRQFNDDMGLHRTHQDPARRPPDGVWSFGEWRRNTPDLVQKGLRVSEENLLPHYLETARRAAPALLEMFERAVDLVPAVENRLASKPIVSERVRTLLMESGPHFHADNGDLSESGLAYARVARKVTHPTRTK